MQNVDILLVHQDPAWLKYMHEQSDASFFSVATPDEGRAFLDKAENNAGLALIQVPHLTPGSPKDLPGLELLQLAIARGIPALALLEDSEQEPMLPYEVQVAPSFIGGYDLRLGQELLGQWVHSLRHNRRIKTLAWADDETIQRTVHTELQRCMFKVHSTTAADAIPNILKNNPDVSLLVLASAQNPELLLNTIKAVRQSHSRHNLSILCLLGKNTRDFFLATLQNGADAYLYMPFFRQELQARCTLEASKIVHLRRVTAQNEQKNLMLATVAHDLRTPLEGIRGYARKLLSEPRGTFSSEYRAILSSISRTSGEAIQMAGDFLDVSVLEQGCLRLNLQPNRLDLLAAERLRLATQIAWGKSLRIRRILSEVTCMMDRARMGQVIDNLIVNAIRYTPAGKDIILKVSQNNGEAVLSITNQGEGILPEERSNLFKPYFVGSAGYNSRNESPEQRKSSGLGLYIAAKLVSAHKGRIWAESRIGEETSFFVALPRASAKAPIAKAPVAKATVKAAGSA